MSRLHLVSQERTLAPAPERGALLTAGDIVGRLKAAGEKDLTARWVRDNVTPRLRLSRYKFRWYEADFHAWLESRRETR